ncbi:MAG TPA: hypothetical protein VIN11_02405, partial [Roseivirga sp.]
MKVTPEEIYQKRLNQFSAEVSEFKSRSRNLSWLRVLSFIIFIIGFVYLANIGRLDGLLYALATFLIIYIYLLKKHETVKSHLKVLEGLMKINSDELLRADFQLRDLDDGAEYYLGNHPYHIDLDIFGKHSLFQLINRTSSLFGKRILASWLSTHADKSDILKRQVAVQELSEMIELRQSFHAQGLAEDQPEHSNTQALFNWLKSDAVIKNKGIYSTLLVILPVITVSAIVLSSLGIVQTGLPILLMFVNAGILGTLFSTLLEITKQTENGYKSLRSLKEQIKLIENTTFQTEYLRLLKSRLSPENGKASQVLKELSSILDNLQNRANLLYIIFNLTFVIDIYWYLKISKWKAKNEANLEEWFEV